MTSFEAKLSRAHEHLEELRLEIDTWRESHPCRLSDKLDRDTGDNVIYGQLTRPFPSRILQLTGDCLQNLRSSLDHLAYALALANKPSLTDTEARQTAFPIFRDPKGFEGSGIKDIRHLSSRTQAVIKRLQPCYTRNPSSHILWHLSTLNNIDKHRRLLINLPTFFGSRTSCPPGTMREFFTYSGDGVLGETETEIARYRCSDPKTSKRVKMNLYPTLEILFGDIPDEERTVPMLLDGIGSWIGSVVLRQLYPCL